MGAGGMAGEHDPIRVAPMRRDIFPHPGDRGGGILDKSRELDFRIEPVVGHDRDEAARGKALPDEFVIDPFAFLPTAAVEENDDGFRGARLGRFINVQAMTRIRAIRDVADARIAVLWRKRIDHGQW